MKATGEWVPTSKEGRPENNEHSAMNVPTNEGKYGQRKQKREQENSAGNRKTGGESPFSTGSGRPMRRRGSRTGFVPKVPSMFVPSPSSRTTNQHASRCKCSPFESLRIEEPRITLTRCALLPSTGNTNASSKTRQ